MNCRLKFQSQFTRIIHLLLTKTRDHFLNAELLNYFNDKHQVNYQFIENGLPPKLQDYQLVAGTAEAREILPRELEVINF
jgi:hypothetical protein